MEVDAFLCDAATVREGLLHILGGGITRLGRGTYSVELLLNGSHVRSLRVDAHDTTPPPQGEG